MRYPHLWKPPYVYARVPTSFKEMQGIWDWPMPRIILDFAWDFLADPGFLQGPQYRSQGERLDQPEYTRYTKNHGICEFHSCICIYMHRYHEVVHLNTSGVHVSKYIQFLSNSIHLYTVQEDAHIYNHLHHLATISSTPPYDTI